MDRHFVYSWDNEMIEVTPPHQHPILGLWVKFSNALYFFALVQKGDFQNTQYGCLKIFKRKCRIDNFKKQRLTHSLTIINHYLTSQMYLCFKYSSSNLIWMFLEAYVDKLTNWPLLSCWRVSLKIVNTPIEAYSSYKAYSNNFLTANKGQRSCGFAFLMRIFEIVDAGIESPLNWL